MTDNAKVYALQDESAYAHTWNTSHQRARALSSFVRYSLGDRPPIGRVHNVRGQDT
jgi:hypothetical protein